MNRRSFAKLAAAWVTGGLPLAIRTSRASGLENEPNRRRLDCHWQERKGGSYICDLADGNHGPFDFDSLFINGRHEILARFPDADSSGRSTYLAGVRFLPSGILVPDFGDAVQVKDIVAIEFDAATFSQKRWGQPELATLCLKQNRQDLRMAICAIDYDHNLVWCTRPKNLDQPDLTGTPYFYVENVYEEMNATHEWYLDRKLGYLYYRPLADTDMTAATVEVN